MTIAWIPWIRTTRGANTTVVHGYATLAAVCMLIPFGTAPLASAVPLAGPSVQPSAIPAAPLPLSSDDGSAPSGPPGVLDAPDGCVLTVVGSDESEVPVPPLTNASTSREYDVSGTFIGTVTCR
ncbi:MspA family porin [Mycobacterium sp.]|uniref:MspA family porin n=1 Tax=Mycobacterium sp. TaxID=1785 RepID=UPI002D5B70D2|nr:MspA family porin [Mycobacterium sp.]HZA09075.1 MspA family porin [Mycobacterium sp.]